MNLDHNIYKTPSEQFFILTECSNSMEFSATATH